MNGYLISACAYGNENAEPSASVEFDDMRLQKLNIAPQQAQYFASKALFLPGTKRITLFVNGQSQGDIIARFNEQGSLCVDEKLLEGARLVSPETNPNKTLVKKMCPSVDVIFPGSTVEYRTKTSAVYLVVPFEAIKLRERATKQFKSGGTAGLLNYDAFLVHSKYGNNQRQEFQSLNTVAGFNAGDWLLRSAQGYTAFNQHSQWTRQYAYAQKSFTGIASTVQAGEISTGNSIYSGIPLTGIQLVPEDSLRAKGLDSQVSVEGVAYSAGRVEIRQDRTLVHTSIVSAGPFSLTDLPLNTWQDVEVTVIENTGSRSAFTIPASGLSSTVFNSAPGYSFAVGQYRLYAQDHGETPLLLTGATTWPVSPYTTATGALIGTQNYKGLGWTLGQRVTPTLDLAFTQRISNTQESKSGTSINASLGVRLLPTVSLALTTTQNTQGYREFEDTLYRGDSHESSSEFLSPIERRHSLSQRTRDQYGVSMGWSNPMMGSFRISTSYATRFDDRSYQYVNGAWSNTLGKARVDLNVQKSTSISRYPRGSNNNNYQAVLSLSLPLGQQTRFYARSDQYRTRSGISYSDQVNDKFGYQLQAEHEDQTHGTQLSAATNLLPLYTNATLGYSQSSSDNSSYNARVSGALVAHDHGITLSPYPVGDTFSIISVGNMSGIKVSTPSGPVWTDPFGQAVAPGLAAFGESLVSIPGIDLPHNVDVANSIKRVNAARGSVQRIEFDAITTRRVILKVTGVQGEPLPQGLSVLDHQGNYLTQSLEGGKLYFPSLEPKQTLNVILSENSSCLIQYTLPERIDTPALFETLEATCLDINGTT